MSKLWVNILRDTVQYFNVRFIRLAKNIVACGQTDMSFNPNIYIDQIPTSLQQQITFFTTSFFKYHNYYTQYRSYDCSVLDNMFNML